MTNQTELILINTAWTNSTFCRDSFSQFTETTVGRTDGRTDGYDIPITPLFNALREWMPQQ